MKFTDVLGTAVLSLSSLVLAQSGNEKPSSKTWNFDSDAVGKPPAGFSFGRTGKGAEGQWVVRAENDAPSKPNVLAQVSTDTTDYRFPVAFTGPDMKDLRLSVKCKPISGKGDHVQVFFENKKIIDAHDKTFPDAGKVGLWTKADSVIYFDNLVATPL